ncbi:MAG: alpha/beta hydrolase fold domain-containing protein [Spirochaetales bacterium]
MQTQKTKQAIKKLKHLFGNSSVNIEKFRNDIEKVFACPILPNRVECFAETINSVPCDVLVPQVCSTSRVILYVHGGSFVGGSPASWRGFCASLAHIACTKIIIPHMKLAPQYPFPAAFDDIKHVVKELYTRPESITLIADSSGTNIALPVVFKIKGNFRKKINEIFLLSPWLDLSMYSQPEKPFKKPGKDTVLNPACVQWSSELYTYSENLQNPLISPVFATDTMLENLPPVYIQIGENELFEQNAVEFQKRLKNLGIPCIIDKWKGMMPMFQMADDFLPEAHAAIEKVGTYLKKGYF